MEVLIDNSYYTDVYFELLIFDGNNAPEFESDPEDFEIEEGSTATYYFPYASDKEGDKWIETCELEGGDSLPDFMIYSTGQI
jgi:hypothetical protein